MTYPTVAERCALLRGVHAERTPVGWCITVTVGGTDPYRHHHLPDADAHRLVDTIEQEQTR